MVNSISNFLNQKQLRIQLENWIDSFDNIIPDKPLIVNKKELKALQIEIQTRK